MVIRAEDVRRRYGDTVALDGVSLSVESGEVFALVGPNGAGKTTLIRALTGTTDAEGSIEVFGRPPTEVARHRLGVLPQEFAPAARLTARELVAYYAGLYDDARDVDAVLADVGLADSADTHYEDLSGGQKRRACVGTTLVNDPDLLVLDEPTTGIDPNGRRDIWELVGGLADGGTTVLLTTHYMEEAEELADTVGLLAAGRLAAVGSPGDLVARHGGESRLVVEAADEGAATRALEHAGYHLLLDEHHVAIPVDPGEISTVVETLDDSGVTYDGLVWRQPSLDDVYVALTGRSVDADSTDADADADSTGADVDVAPTGSDGTVEPEETGDAR